MLGNLFRKIHLWIGLSSGILIFLICISGATYAFRDEIFNKIHKNKLTIDLIPDDSSHLPLNKLWKIAQEALGHEHSISYLSCYSNPYKTWQFKAYKYEPGKIGYNNWLAYDFIAYINPYTGEVVDVLNHKWEFFHLVKIFHWSLLFNTKFGQPIVSFTVVVFLISLLTGLYMWWPFRKRKKGYAISKKSKKILNYDLHNVLGFYTLPINIILTLTGMIWTFKWFMILVYIITNMSTENPENKVYTSTQNDFNFSNKIYNQIYRNALKSHPKAKIINIYPADTAQNGTIDIYVRNSEKVYYQAFLEQYDKYSGNLLFSKGFNELNRGEKIITMNYDIHTGAVLGITGKIFAFIGALIGASLPVTGFIVWLNKRKIKLSENNNFLSNLNN